MTEENLEQLQEEREKLDNEIQKKEGKDQVCSLRFAEEINYKNLYLEMDVRLKKASFFALGCLAVGFLVGIFMGRMLL